MLHGTEPSGSSHSEELQNVGREDSPLGQTGQWDHLRGDPADVL